MNKRLQFPKNFYWGAASASYQVEGNIYNTDWAFEARTSKRVPVADSGPDHFNRYEEDFDIAVKLGHNAHRISIEWARIEPHEGEFSTDAIRHYERVIKALKKRKLEPFITLWHFTLPQWLYEQGGMESKKFAEYFARYASFVTDHLGDLCNHWSTINEPNVVASNGFMRGNWPPLKKRRPFLMIKVLNNLADAHIAAYKVIKKKDLISEISIVKDNIYISSNKNPFNILSAFVFRRFWNHYFLNKIKNHIDSIGLNYYFHKKFGDTKVYKKNDMGWDIFPEGIYHALMELKRYNVPVFVSEAGIADELDIYRADYITGLIYWIHQAMSDGVDVRGYLYWSMTDNFEWALGYGKRFGLVAIDYKTKERTIRDSAYEYKKICEANALVILTDEIK